MKNNKHVLWITRTAIFLALLVISQAVFRPLGQYVLGTANNLIFVVAAVLLGLSSSAVISVLSPLLAFFLGFGPALPQIIPIVMLGNFAFSLIWILIVGKKSDKQALRFGFAIALAAVTKFLFLWVGVVLIAIPLLALPEKQALVLSAAFSYPQLITAAAGSLIASLILPPLRRVFKNSLDKASM